MIDWVLAGHLAMWSMIAADTTSSAIGLHDARIREANPVLRIAIGHQAQTARLIGVEVGLGLLEEWCAARAESHHRLGLARAIRLISAGTHGVATLSNIRVLHQLDGG